MKFRHCQRLRQGHWEPIEFEMISPGDKIKLYEADGTYVAEFTAISHATPKGKLGNYKVTAKNTVERESK